MSFFQNEETIFSYSDTVELLAYDRWSGLLIMPEVITAFVTPNHPLISEVLSRASAFLREWNKLPSFTGYQTNNPNNVKIQMAAIFAALRSWKIIYNSPPASYETIGQRVRLPHKVLEEKQGTCLDLSVLYAACLEAAGLFHLLVFIKGHAFCGCWLEQQTFSDCAVDDVSAIEKRIVAGNEEILLVECTNFTCGSNVDFERAIKHGNDHLNKPTDFQYVVDIQRSRGSGIRPIPVKINQAFSGFTSSGESASKVEPILDTVITFVDKAETVDNGNIFYWNKNQNPAEYCIYRVDDQSDCKRSIDDISSYEILNAVIEVLSEQISLHTDDLIKETAKKLGYSRTGTLIDSTVRNAVMLGQQNNILKISGGKASLC